MLFNPCLESLESLPLDNIVTEEEVSSTTLKTIVVTEEDDNKQMLSSSRRGRPRSKPVTGTVLKERRNVS